MWGQEAQINFYCMDDYLRAGIKGTVSRDVRHFFCKKKPPGPHMNRQSGLAKLVVFAKIFAKECPRCRCRQRRRDHNFQTS